MTTVKTSDNQPDPENADQDRINWLCQCTAKEWEDLQDARLSHPTGYLREAIDLMRNRTYKKIALTGGIACGKSTLAAFLRELGCEVLDTDDVTHAMEAPGGEAVEPILNAFGSGVQSPDGGIDRKKLGELVFADRTQMDRLNAILHPRIRAVMERWLSEPSEHPKIAVVPLLFEVGWDKGWDAIICVACSPREQMRRLRDRGLTESEAWDRLGSQMPIEWKRKKSSHVVENVFGLNALKMEAQRLVKEFTATI